MQSGALSPVLVTLAGCALLGAGVARHLLVVAVTVQLGVLVVVWVVGLVGGAAHPAPRYVHGTDPEEMAALLLGTVGLVGVGWAVVRGAPRSEGAPGLPPTAEPASSGR